MRGFTVSATVKMIIPSYSNMQAYVYKETTLFTKNGISDVINWAHAVDRPSKEVQVHFQ